MYQAKETREGHLSEVVKRYLGVSGEKVYLFSEAGNGGVYWVEILLVASGRNSAPVGLSIKRIYWLK